MSNSNVERIVERSENFLLAIKKEKQQVIEVRCVDPDFPEVYGELPVKVVPVKKANLFLEILEECLEKSKVNTMILLEEMMEDRRLEARQFFAKNGMSYEEVEEEMKTFDEDFKEGFWRGFIKKFATRFIEEFLKERQKKIKFH